MAVKTYLYQPTGAQLADVVPLVNLAATPVIGSPSSVLFIPIQIDELYKEDLDDAMASLGYAFVSESTDPFPAPTINYGAQPVEPTPPPAPTAGSVYYNTTEERWYFYDAGNAVWVALPDKNTSDAFVGSYGTPTGSNMFVTNTDPRLVSTGGGDFVGPVGAGNDNVVIFDGPSGKIGKDVGLLWTDIVLGPPVAVDENIAIFDGTTGKLIRDGGISLADLDVVVKTGKFPLQIGFSSQAQPYITTNSTTYTTLGTFRFPGTALMGAPVAARAIAWRSGGGGSVDLRIIDITNVAVIAEVTGITSASETIQDLGPLSNLPAASAIWEVQMRRAGGGTTAVLASVDLEF